MSKKICHSVAILCFVFIVGGSTAWAGAQTKEEPLPVLKTKPTILTVFKNGLGFFTREGTTELRNGWAVTEEVPAAALGSLWITSLEPGSPVEETVSYIVEVEKSAPAGSLDALITANIGKKIVLTANNQIFEGVIKAASGNGRHPDDARRRRGRPQQRLGRKVEFHGDHAVDVAAKSPAKRMKFKLAGRGSKGRLMLSYLQKGVTWQPSYLVNIEDPKKARLTMKATLVNDAEDLEGVDAYFVVGYPNFRFADVRSPMALDQAMGQFLAELDRAESKDEALGRMAGVMTQRMAPLQEATSLDYGLSGLPGVAGASEEDLFLYGKKGLTLKKGERAEYPIFSHEVDYKHVYEWKVPDTLNVDPAGYQQSGQRHDGDRRAGVARRQADERDGIPLDDRSGVRGERLEAPRPGGARLHAARDFDQPQADGRHGHQGQQARGGSGPAAGHADPQLELRPGDGQGRARHPERQDQGRDGGDQEAADRRGPRDEPRRAGDQVGGRTAGRQLKRPRLVGDPGQGRRGNQGHLLLQGLYS